jgi:hypothetical protein
MEALATSLDVTVCDVALCNFYYDTLKVVAGLYRIRSRD